MNSKTIILIMACVLPLRELHRHFSVKVQTGLYLIDQSYPESPAWYVHDIVTKLSFAVLLLFWALRERGKDRILSKYLGVFTVFYTLVFVLYLLNHSQAGNWYLCVYIPVLAYGIYITTKRD